MNALANLIKRVTKVQFSRCKDVDELSKVLDRTVAFATGENPYLTEADVDEIAATIPIIDPVTEHESDSEPVAEGGGTDAQDAAEVPAEGVSDGKVA